jgi:hypothetical protein
MMCMKFVPYNLCDEEELKWLDAQSPPYCPDLAPADIFLFPEVKIEMSSILHDLTFRQMWWQNWIISLKTRFSSVSKVYMNAVVSVFGPSWTILTEMVNKHTALCIIVFIIFQFHYFLTTLCI